MKKVIDLTQPFGKDAVAHPSFPKPLVLRLYTHQDVQPGTPTTCQAELLIASNHAGTHVDSMSHFDPDPKALKIDEMPLDLFYGEGTCIDLRSFPPRYYVKLQEIKDVVKKNKNVIKKGDVLLFCTGHYEKTKGTPAYLTEFPGIEPEVVYWMKEQGVKIFGVDNMSPDQPSVTDKYPTHMACKEVGMTHYENLCNLAAVVNKRFQFYGFPTLIEHGGGGHVRAIAILDE